MYLPPYHWKSQSKESTAKYYAQVQAMGISGQKLKSEQDIFISNVKKEGFIVEEI